MTIELTASLAASIVSALLGLAALWTKRGSLLHRIFALGMLTFALEQAALFVSLRTADSGTAALSLRLGLAALAFSPSLWLAFTLAFGQHQERRKLGRGWLTLLASVSLASLALVLMPGFVAGSPDFQPPVNWVISLGWPGKIYFSILLLMSTLIIAGLERTLFSAPGHVRWQLRSLVLGLVGIFACRIYTASNAILLAQKDTQIEVVNSLVLMLAGFFILFGMRRSGVLDLDVYISHTLPHRSVAVMAVAIYLVAAALAVQFSNYFEQVPYLPAILVPATFLVLLAAFLSDRLRQGLSLFISRRFKRPLYAYRDVWRSFTLQTAAVVDRPQLSRTVVQIVSETLQALSVTIWRVSSDAGRADLEASTALTYFEGQQYASRRLPFQILLAGMSQQEGGIDLHQGRQPWCRRLRREHARWMEQAMIRYCFPMRARGDLLALLTLEGRAGDRPLSEEDYDLLTVICDQTAAQMLNIELSQRLRQAKEMEVFQNMSAFFIHDLKNLGSRLALTADNLPKYFDNPEFRQDATRVMQRSVEKIKTFCRRLSTLQKGGTDRQRSDLNALLERVAGELRGTLGVSLQTELSPLPPVMMDPEQIHSVASNLLINAAQASNQGSPVCLSSRVQNGAVEFAVRDEGCGMSREFLRDRLFRPFETTKKEGMGIGLYQSKLIVEAHAGQIEVDSQEGQGTTFRVQLPAADEKEAQQ